MTCPVRGLARCLLFLVAGMVCGAAPRPPETGAELTVYAAASLREALQEIGPRCEGAAGARLVFNFGGTNDLARQILAANKADIFFSADTDWMDRVARDGMVDATSRRSLLSNRLVVIVPEDSRLAIVSAVSLTATQIKRLALANPDAVPAGRYAKAWLDRSGVWDQVSARVVGFPDVRATLAAVESGGVDAGIVYGTDARIARHAKVAYEVPARESPPIAYAVAAMKDRPGLASARRAIDCFAAADARAVFERLGFIVLETP